MLRIDVLDSDITRARLSGCCVCPIEVALERITGGKWRVATTAGECYCAIERGLPIRGATLPSVAAKLARNWDAFQKVSPCSFDLDIPPADAGTPLTKGLTA